MKEKEGHTHIISQAVEEIRAIFKDIGFSVAEGPEAETEFYNFDALNFPKNHPARDMQDTFWMKEPNKKGERLLLRTHTSPVQIRYLENHKPPVAIIVPGKVFRNEATDATHEAQFHQVEGLYVAEDASLAMLKGVLEYFFKKYFGDDVEIIFRPSFFPFVEPGVEVAMKWKGRLLEVMGAGMVHPNVLKASGIDPKKYKGFAFGGGIDRFIMLKYGIDDIRVIYNGDLRLVNQF